MREFMSLWSEIKDIEIEYIIKDMDVSKNSNIEFINSKLLKDCFKLSVKPLAFLFNMICTDCIIPDAWKEALVIPLYKEGDKGTPSNYRPISLLPAISKLFEKLIYSRLYRYLNMNMFFAANQGGFRPNTL